MEAKAVSRYVRTSPRKVRIVTDLIRGLSVEEAYSILQYSQKDAATVVLKTLRSAVSNALNRMGSLQLSVEDLRVSGIWVDEGPTMKRFRARAMGRVARIRKRTSHITVVVNSES